MDQEEKKPSDPHITLFGEEINGSKEEKENKKEESEWKKEWRKEWNRCSCGHYNRCNCGGGAGGIAILFAGVILLLNTIGIVPWEFWQFIWPFWPAFLVLLGIRILLGRNWFSRIISSLLALAFFTCITAYGLVRVNSSLVNSVPREFIDFINNFKPFNQ